MTTFSSPKSSFQTPNSLALKNSFLKKPPLKSGTIQPVKPIVFKQKPTIVFPVQSPSGLNQHHIRPHFRSTHDFSDASKENDEKSKENTRDVSSQNQKLSTKTDIDRSGESPQNNSAFGKSFVLKKHTTRSSSDIKKSLVLPTKTQNGSLTPSFAVSQTPKILPNDPNPHLKGTSSNASFKKLQEAKTNDHHEAHKNTLKSGSKEDLPGETREVNNEGNIKNNTSLIEKDSSPADSSFKTNMIIQKKKLKMKITNVAVKSKAGCSGRRVQKTNQDSFINLPQFIESRGIGLFGILDGHGTFGHHVSQFVKTSLPRNIEEIIQKMPNGSLSDLQITEALTQAFTDTLEELKKTSIDCYVSGTTCNLCLVYKNKVFCANAGDSRALLLRSKAPKHKQFEAITMSEDHKVDLEKEKMRILAAGGRVEPYKDSKKGEPIGPARVWLKKEELPGLAMSRSIGDFLARTVGVISEPDVSVFKLVPTDRAIIMASDGLWEFITNEEVAKISFPFYQKNKPESLCEKLISESNARWLIEDDIIDDTTIIAIFLQGELSRFGEA